MESLGNVLFGILDNGEGGLSGWDGRRWIGSPILAEKLNGMGHASAGGEGNSRARRQRNPFARERLDAMFTNLGSATNVTIEVGMKLENNGVHVFTCGGGNAVAVGIPVKIGGMGCAIRRIPDWAQVEGTQALVAQDEAGEFGLHLDAMD